MVQVSADAGYHPAAELTIHILPGDARERLLEADGQLYAWIVGRPCWTQAYGVPDGSWAGSLS